MKGGLTEMGKSEQRVVRTTVWSPGCGSHGGCGLKLIVEGDRLVKVEGDEAHPWNQGRLCAKGLALTQYLDHPDRVRHPLKRVGERGEGRWEQISWDEALDTCEERLRDIRDKYGAESVIFGQGTGRDVGGPITYLAYAYGSPNWVQIGLAGHSCYTPRQAGMFVTDGDYTVADCSQFLERRYDDPQWVPPKVIINWAQNPIAGCFDGFYGHWIVDAMKRGSKLIVIDPRVTWLASRAEIHLQNRPGTDGAIALAMLNVIINEGLYDHEFVDKWCYGFDELKERVQDYPLDKVAELAWIDADDLRRAAHLYAESHPAAIHWGVPVDGNAQGTVAAQAISQLWCVTGNIDIPGGNVIAKPAFGVTTYPFTSQEMVDLYGEELIRKLNEKRIGADRYPMLKNFRGWGQPDVALEQIESGKPYEIHGAWIQTSNPIGGQAADPKRHLAALRKLDFIVVVDTFQTPTSMALADIFLPAAATAEKESFRNWWWPLTNAVKAIDAGDTRSDWEINFEMAKRLSERPIEYETVKDLFDDRLKPAGITFDELAERGSWIAPTEGPSVPYRRYERGLLRADGQPGFNTPTGKIELSSTRLVEWGLDPLPYHEEPPEGPVTTPELWEKYPLIFASGRRLPVFFHSEHRMIPWLREIAPDPLIEVHPETAAEYGVADGEWVYAENNHGRAKYKVQITPTAHPRVVSVGHGWWLPETEGKAPSLFSYEEHNCNQLVPMGTQSRGGYGGSAYKTVLCRLVKIGEEG
jgi:anaerobic selenocysteine-containing dehydrogenase